MLTPIPDHPPPKYQAHLETPPALPARPKRLELESRSTFSRSSNHRPSQKTHRSEQQQQNSREVSTPSLVHTPRVQRYFSSPLSPHLLLPDFTPPPGRPPKIQRKRHEQFSPVPHMTSDPSSYSVATTMTVSYKRSETDSSFTDSLLESQHQGLSQLAELRLGSTPIREIQSPPLPKRKNINKTVISHQGNSSECSSKLTSRFERRKQIARYVRVLWLGLSVTITSVSIFSYIQPHWFVSQATATSLGVFGYCEPNRLKSARYGEGLGRWKHYVEPDVMNIGDWRFHRSSSGYNVPRVCSLYGGKAALSNMPSNVWQVGCVMFGGGCALLLVSSVCALLCFMLTFVEALRQRISVGRLCTHTAYVQVMSAFLLMTGVAIFPFALDSKIASHYCLGSNPAKASYGCQLGWSYALAVTASALSVFCPLLAYYSKDIYSTK